MRSSSRSEPNPELDVAAMAAREADRDAEAKAAFHLRMRARGIRDLAVLRAFELVPRHVFVPHRYVDLADRDLPLPIGCGQTQNAPWLLARMVEALRPQREHRVLEIGSGTGYATAVLAHLCGEVIGVERFQSLALAAQARLESLAIANAAVIWADGLNLPSSVGRFDRIIAHGLLNEPEVLLSILSEGGVLVCAGSSTQPSPQHLICIVREGEGGRRTVVGESRLQVIQPGLAAAL